MSDYLWDKTGEPEADVEQLENLLGSLKYKQRPLEIPATAMPNVARPAAATTIFSRPRLAIAAALILMLLAGTWLVTRQGEPQPDRMAEVEQGSPADQRKQPETTVVPNAGTHENALVNNVEQTKPRENLKADVVTAAAPKTHRQSRQTVATRPKRQPRRREENSPTPPREEVATVNPEPTGLQLDQTLTPQQREATEQLMFALRLASAKLNYAQREMREIGRAGK